MPKKIFEIGDGLTIAVYKRKNNRNLRLTIAAGEARVSIPAWAPYKAGVDFALKRADWIKQQLQPKILLKNGQMVGKAHRLYFAPKPGAVKPTSRIDGTEIKINVPPFVAIESSEVQAVAQKACLKALRKQAENLLPQRLAGLAQTHNFTYQSVKVKQLKGRWGSCDQSKNITLNIFLMQLPWELIDYVLIHELTHTQILQHGPVFWDAMESKVNNLKQRRRAIRGYSPILIDTAA